VICHAPATPFNRKTMQRLAAIDALVVDDHEPSRSLNARALRDAGCGGVREAESGAAALALLAAQPAGLMLVDQRMPGMDGAAFIAAVRADPRLAHARIVMITGSCDPQVAETARAAGADVVLVKPAPPSAVVRAVLALLT
jgi:CheY-like chemotaxis protein